MGHPRKSILSLGKVSAIAAGFEMPNVWIIHGGLWVFRSRILETIGKVRGSKYV